AARQEEARERATEARIRHDLRAAFTETLFQQDNQRLREEIAARWKRNAELVAARLSAGKEEASSLEQAQAEVTKAGFEVARAGRAVLRARQKLSRAMGRERFEVFAVAGNWDAAPPPVNPEMNGMVERTPEVQEATAALEGEQAALRESGAAFWPSVDASVSLARDGPAWPPAESRSWTAGLSVSYALFSGLRDRVNLAAARNAAEAAREDLLIARRETLESFEEALSPYADAYEAVSVRRQSRDAARARAETARSHYETGDTGFDQWHEVEQGLVEAETEALGAQREALDAESGWRRAIGEGFPK
ncbi:MAG: TolC family protein, partial [bacterium]